MVIFKLVRDNSLLIWLNIFMEDENADFYLLSYSWLNLGTTESQWLSFLLSP